MKRLHYLSFLIGIACLVSCHDNTDDYTPYISYSFFYVNPTVVDDTLRSAQDTIVSPTYDASLGAYVWDTLAVNDTLFAVVAFGTYSNYLTATHVEHDGEALSVFTDHLDVLSSALSSYDEGLMSFYYKSGYNLAVMPVYIVPKKTGVWKVRFVCESDSRYSPTAHTFLLPVQ